MTIEEGNKIINDFVENEIEPGSIHNYHLSWGSIMIAVCKIQRDPAVKVRLPMNGIKESIMPFLNARRAVVKALIDCNLRDLWIAVIEFIQWYQDAIKYLEKQDIIISGTSNGLIDKTNG